MLNSARNTAAGSRNSIRCCRFLRRRSGRVVVDATRPVTGAMGVVIAEDSFVRIDPGAPVTVRYYLSRFVNDATAVAAASAAERCPPRVALHACPTLSWTSATDSGGSTASG